LCIAFPLGDEGRIEASVGSRIVKERETGLESGHIYVCLSLSIASY